MFLKLHDGTENKSDEEEGANNSGDDETSTYDTESSIPAGLVPAAASQTCHRISLEVTLIALLKYAFLNWVLGLQGEDKNEEKYEPHINNLNNRCNTVVNQSIY